MVRVRLYALQEKSLVRIPGRLLKDHQISSGTGTVSFGQRQVSAAVKRDTKEGRMPRLGLGSDILTGLGLRTGTTLLASWDANRSHLCLGPVVAIMAWRYYSSSRYLFGSASEMASIFVRVAQRRGVVAYAFSPQDINWEKGRVIGYVPYGKRWRRVVMPLPDVVYDRIPTRRLDSTRLVQQTKSKFMEMPHLYYFNPCFLDKWETHEILATDPSVQRYLPKTERLASLDQLGQWLKFYSTIYIKPSQGSLGLGVTKVSRMTHGYRYHRTRMGGGSSVGVADSLPKLQKRLRAVLPRRRLIVQRGLRLARYHGRPYDIRIMVQKTPKGNWVCTNMIARVAPVNSAVSNVAEGGTMISVRRAIRGSLRINSRSAIRRIRQAARAIAAAVESGFGQEFGEFGIDMAFDTRGRLWLIEVNSKPGRQTGNWPGIPPSMRRIVRFAIAKAGSSERM
jgi:glutathione synthase/RimK-type ligase-like ATP-grasp enzyme